MRAYETVLKVSAWSHAFVRSFFNNEDFSAYSYISTSIYEVIYCMQVYQGRFPRTVTLEILTRYPGNPCLRYLF